MLGKTLCNYLALSVASNCLSSRTHRHAFVSRAFVQVMRTGTRGRSRSSSCSERLFSPCCLQHGWFAPPSMTGGVDNPTTMVKNIRSCHVHICSHHLDTVPPTHVRTHSKVSCPPKVRRPNYVSYQHEKQTMPMRFVSVLSADGR